MKKAVKRTVSDLKQRVPGWISEKVMEEYNIKKKDIREALKIKSRTTTVEISGVKVDSLDFVFKGSQYNIIILDYWISTSFTAFYCYFFILFYLHIRLTD